MNLLVDAIVLHRSGTIPPVEVVEAVRQQQRIDTRLHFVTGPVEAEDKNRWFTIARARNLMRKVGNAPWVMFVDDDVILHPECIHSLWSAMRHRADLAACGADYLKDGSSHGRAQHVSMGATLFRRDILERLVFRATNKLCECWCAAFDLRHNGFDICYVPEARARHLKASTRSVEKRSFTGETTSSNEGIVLAAFDRRDIDRFERHFLKTLRSGGNHGLVLAVGYGVWPSEARRLARLSGVQFIQRPNNGQMVPVRRLEDFARLAEKIGSTRPLAYWDVADVLFQGSLEPLWETVRGNPGRLMAVAEPKGYPFNAVIPAWTLSIRDKAARIRAASLLKQNVFLNSGFAAGSAATMQAYFERATQMLAGRELAGTTDWGDQMALNVYCHSQPEKWRRLPECWNYCVHDRAPGEVAVRADGRVVSHSGGNIIAAHGNARSLRQFGLVMK